MLGRNLSFINGSSLQYLYGSRLVRAYLGASNEKRHRPRKVSVTDVVAGDDCEFADYNLQMRGGPLHLINITFNETCSGESQLEQRDRKGLPFVIGPAGLSVGARFHAHWTGGAKDRGSLVAPIPVGRPCDDFQMFPRRSELSLKVEDWTKTQLGRLAPSKWMENGPESPTRRQVQRLTLGHWIAISGAAFGTGMGQRTCLGYSLLTGLANIRLGYWWDSHVNPTERRKQVVRSGPGGLAGKVFAWLFPVQSSLLDEWLGRFHGPAREQWYLSDGGHFENTAVYELLRRRVPHIICCDCGADPNCDFPDLANLVRKARIDFGAEVKFVPRNRLKDPRFRKALNIPKELRLDLGTCEDFTEGKKTGKQPHGLLAAVHFQPDQTGKADSSLVLFLKPSLSGDEPLDLWEYNVQHSEFPQESTADQFFDEAQWESYRKLGEHTAFQVLTRSGKDAEWFFNVDPKQTWDAL
jgi:hypothetical protein